MKKILFVCLGNICRSPMAEFIMKDEVRRQNRAGDFLIASAGTSGEEEGNPVYPPARAELAKHGISCEGKRAKKFLPSDYSAYDYILCMENSHVRELRRQTGDPDKKIFRLLDFTSSPHDIADPWYTRNFSLAYAQIAEGVRAFLLFLQKGDEAQQK